MEKPKEGVDFYWKNGKIIFTENHHQKRGYCCGGGCINCAYDPPSQKGNTKLKGENK